MFDMPDWGAVELDWMRALLATALLVEQVSAGSRPLTHPVGLARFVDLRYLTLESSWGRRAVTLAAVLFAVDLWRLPALLLLAIVFLARLTVRSSRGSVNHGYHLMLVVVIALLAAELRWVIADVVFDDQVDALTRERTAMWWSLQAGTALYFCSGIAKLANTGLGWTGRSLGLLLDARQKLMIPTGRLQSRLAPRALDLGVRHPRMMRLLFAGGLLAEVLAPLGLINRYTLLAAGVALLVLHFANGVTLGLWFAPNSRIVAVLWVNVPGLVITAF